MLGSVTHPEPGERGPEDVCGEQGRAEAESLLQRLPGLLRPPGRPRQAGRHDGAGRHPGHSHRPQVPQDNVQRPLGPEDRLLPEHAVRDGLQAEEGGARARVSRRGDQVAQVRGSCQSSISRYFKITIISRNLLSDRVTFVPSANKVVIPEFLLRPPLFHPGYPYNVNLGGLGVMVAEAVVEGVLGSGSVFTASGLPIL